jgi:hypothetical protein
MKYDIELTASSGGNYTATCEELGLSVEGAGPDSALQELHASMRYHLELCPCSSIEDDWIEMQVHRSEHLG